MALVANDYFRAVRMLGGGETPLITVGKETAVTWLAGAVLIGTGGYAVEATDGPTSGTIIGVAACAATSGPTTALVVPALPNVIFSGRMATGNAGATYSTAVTDRYVMGYGVALDATGTWYIDQSDTTDDAVMIIEFVDAIGTAWGKVHFTFIDSVWNSAAL